MFGIPVAEVHGREDSDGGGGSGGREGFAVGEEATADDRAVLRGFAVAVEEVKLPAAAAGGRWCGRGGGIGFCHGAHSLRLERNYFWCGQRVCDFAILISPPFLLFW